MVFKIVILILQSFSFAGTSPKALEISANTATAWLDVCQKLTVQFVSDSHAPTSSGLYRTVQLRTTQGALFSDTLCKKSIKRQFVGPNTVSFDIYFKSSEQGTADVHASASKLKTGTITLHVGLASADISLGQVAMNFSTANYPILSSQSLYNPYSVSIAAGKMFVADYSNHRVLVWNSIPADTQQPADLVLGQPNMTSAICNNGSLSAQTLCGPAFVHSDGVRLVVADEANSRILIWNKLPTVDQQAADVVLGQADMNSNEDKFATVSSKTLYYPGGVFVSGSRLFVADSGNNRILIWNSFPTVNQQPADVVVGQVNMTSNSLSATRATFTYPYMVSVFGSNMFVADYANNRVLIWNSIPTGNGAAASVVVGQPDFTTSGKNAGGLSSKSLWEPAAPIVDNQGRMYISDFSNNRILVWKQTPTVNFQGADMVIGQPNFVTNTQNTGGVSATSSYNPWGLTFHEGKLWVAEFGNHRVLQYTLPF